MVIPYHNIVFNISKRFIHKYIFNMDKAYFRRLEGDCEQFHFTFRYENKDLKVDRQFNFVRQMSEPVSTFITRLSASLEKAITKKNKKKNPLNIPTELNIILRVDNQDVTNSLLCKEVFCTNKQVSLDVLGKTFMVIINSPWIDALALPSSILATFPVYPSKLEVFHTDLAMTDFIWYDSKDKKNWTECGRNFVFTPSNNLVDSFIKVICTPKNEVSEGPSAEVECNNKIQAGPGVCPFETRHRFTTNRSSRQEFRVVTYNILADLYCDMEYTREVLHPYCPPYALELDYRKQLILKELMGYNADIICLQEVDRKVFKHDLQPFFSHLGYEGNYAIKGGVVAEGEACFYYSKKFSLIQSSRTVFSEVMDKDPLYSHIWSRIVVNEKLTTRMQELRTTLQTNLLQSKDNVGELVLVANTHLYFHPDADHIRLLQGAMAITYIQSCLDHIRKEHPQKRISVIFCGDFNSVPECGIYKLYTTGFVPEDFPDYRSNVEEAVEQLKLEQNIPLASACGTPQYTNFTSGFADCLDYIFYEKSNLKVSQVVPLPVNEELTQHTALPSIVFPSDHIALISDLEWL